MSFIQRRSYYPLKSRIFLSCPLIVPVRTFIPGLGPILGVLANPLQTLKQLDESRRMLEETRQHLRDSYERSIIPPLHTFSRVPGFFDRKRERKVITTVLESTPSFTVLFGASSVGKTALLREVLSDDRYHVIYLDLRIAGFADLTSLHSTLSAQFENFFNRMGDLLPGYDHFKKEALAFKHARKAVEAGGQPPSFTANASSPIAVPAAIKEVQPADVARLMEMFQSALLRYWEFDPEKGFMQDHASGDDGEASPLRKPDAKKEPAPRLVQQQLTEEKEPKWTTPAQEASDGEEKAKKPVKKIPVFFVDEAHKLPDLVSSQDAVKSFLDSLVVITKQDRLCHVLHVTSDTFYMHWLRQMNVGQHCKMITIGDCDKEETKEYFEKHLLPTVPEKLRDGIQFDAVFNVLGGKLAHWSDYVTDFINSQGTMTMESFSHFLQAYSYIQFYLLDPSFSTYTSIPAHPTKKPENFTSADLLTLMRILTTPPHFALYFPLCRKLGQPAVDAMIKSRVLELRYSRFETFDVQGAPAERPFVCAMSPVMQCAMKVVLKEWGEEEQPPRFDYREVKRLRD
ncbi:hypothetical protein HDU85_003903 [Gaertneriomyces sp. JEL0708]|nr:hypothetical protein HDU85_003903 [Gaertneriomyces sp. JEL0708]